MKCWSVAAAAIIIALAPIAALMTSAKAAGLPSETTVNRGVVQLETARAAGPHRPQTAARHRHGDPAAGRARLRAAAERPGIGDWVTYITKLYNAEFHLLARKEITGVTDLANQKVNVDLRGTGTAITAARLFDLLKIPITMTNDDQEVALEKLRKGEIAALCLVSGKPAPIFRDLDGNAGFRFLAIPLDPAVTATYLPTRLTAADYPALVP